MINFRGCENILWKTDQYFSKIVLLHLNKECSVGAVLKKWYMYQVRLKRLESIKQGHDQEKQAVKGRASLFNT